MISRFAIAVCLGVLATGPGAAWAIVPTPVGPTPPSLSPSAQTALPADNGTFEGAVVAYQDAFVQRMDGIAEIERMREERAETRKRQARLEVTLERMQRQHDEAPLRERTLVETMLEATQGQRDAARSKIAGLTLRLEASAEYEVRTRVEANRARAALVSRFGERGRQAAQAIEARYEAPDGQQGNDG